MANYEETYGIAVYDGESFETLFLEGSPGRRLDDIIKWRDDIYIVGKTMYEPPEYDWHGLARMKNGELETVHEEFSGGFGLLWVYSLEVFRDQLVIGGLYHNGLGFTGNGIQAFDGEQMVNFGGGVNSAVYDMKVYKDELYVVGRFTRIGEGVTWLSEEGGTPCEGVAKWDGEKWTCLHEGEFPDWYFGVRALEIYNDTLYIGGNWISMDGDSSMQCIARRPITPKEGLSTVGDFNIYPNPSKESFTLGFDAALESDGFVTLYNSIGQEVSSQGLSAWSREYSVNISSLAAGVYLVKVELGDAIRTKRIIVE